MSSWPEELVDRGLPRPRALVAAGILFTALVVSVACLVWIVENLAFEWNRGDRGGILAYALATIATGSIAVFLGWSLLKLARQARRIVIAPEEWIVDLLLFPVLRIPRQNRLHARSVSCIVVSPEFAVVPGRLVRCGTGWFCISSKLDEYERLSSELRKF